MSAFDRRFQSILASLRGLNPKDYHKIKECVSILYNNQIDFVLITGTGHYPEAYKVNSIVQLFKPQSDLSNGKDIGMMMTLYDQTLAMCKSWNITPLQLRDLRAKFEAARVYKIK